MRAFFVAPLILLAGCGSTIIDAVYLQHPNTSDRVQCGPYTGRSAIYAQIRINEQRGCVDDYQRAGYVRVPDGPS